MTPVDLCLAGFNLKWSNQPLNGKISANLPLFRPKITSSDPRLTASDLSFFKTLVKFSKLLKVRSSSFQKTHQAAILSRTILQIEHELNFSSFFLAKKFKFWKSTRNMHVAARDYLVVLSLFELALECAQITSLPRKHIDSDLSAKAKVPLTELIAKNVSFSCFWL